MTDNTQNLDEQISDILAALYLAGTENGLGRQLTDPAEIMHRKEAFINANPASTEAKQALLDWHNKRELEARIDTLEYAKISPKFKIEEKIEQLRVEAEL